MLRVNTCYFSVVHFFISLYSPPSKRRSLVTDGDGTSLFFFDPLSAKDLGLHPLAELSRPGLEQHEEGFTQTDRHTSAKGTPILRTFH